MVKQKQFMMVLEKLKWFPIISLFFLLLICCKNESKLGENSGLLECALNIYIENSTSKDAFIYVSEMNKWTDSTSIVAIQQSDYYPSKPIDGTKILIGEYNNYTIVYSSDVIEDMISNNISWDEPNYKIENSITLEDIRPFSENELQFTYDKDSKEVLNIVKAYPMEKKNAFEEIQNCP